MQERQSNQNRKNNTARTQTKVILFVLSAVLLSTAIVVQQADALKITVKFKYPSELKEHPKQIGKIYLNAYSDSDEYQKNIKASAMAKLPKSIKFNLDVEKGEKYTVALNSYVRDEGNQKSSTSNKVVITVP